MKKKLLLICSLMLSLLASAQGDSIPEPPHDTLPQPLLLHFGYLSYDEALQSMPDYALAQQKVADLRTAYEAELKRVEDEFNQKYEDFLEGQRDFPRTILLKRQTELQQLMQHNLEFKAQGQRDLKEAEVEALKPLRQKLNELLATLARERGFALIINTDANACPFIDPALGEDIQQDVLLLIK